MKPILIVSADAPGELSAAATPNISPINVRLACIVTVLRPAGITAERGTHPIQPRATSLMPACSAGLRKERLARVLSFPHKPGRRNGRYDDEGPPMSEAIEPKRL